MKEENSRFQFDPKTHRYYINGKKATGVTTILGVIAKPQLISWASNQACDYLLDVVKNKDHGEDPAQFLLDEIENARKAYAKKRDKAADAGTAVHAEVEEAINCLMNGIDWGTDNKQVQHFLDWVKKHDVKFLGSEEQVYSEKLFVAGTYDFACEIDGRKYLGDIKTSNALYPEYFYQCAAYRMMAEEMGQTDFKGSILVNIKRDGSFNEDEDVIISESYEDEKEAFLSALKLYRITNQYKTKYKGSKAL